MPMFEVCVEETFAAGHALRGYKGKCENTHGHNYRVRLTMEGPQLDHVGLLCDFVHVKKVMQEVIRALDGPLAPVPCAAERPTEPCTCPDPRTCPVRLLMEKLRQDLTDWLDARSLEDLARLGASAAGLAFEI